MTVNRARLTDEALAHRSLYGPLRARLVDAGSTAAIEIAESEWVLVGEADRLRDDLVAKHRLDISRKRWFVKGQGSERDERVDWRPLVMLSNGYAGVDEALAELKLRGDEHC